MEAHSDSAVVPWVWQVEVANALGKAVVHGKLPLARAFEIWDELLLLPIRQLAIGNIPRLLQLAVKHDLSLYDTCYLNAAWFPACRWRQTTRNCWQRRSPAGSQRLCPKEAVDGESCSDDPSGIANGILGSPVRCFA
jgi:hypothetical protein